MNDKTELRFLPFHAINEFMRKDFRISVIRTALLALPALDRKFAVPVNQLTKKYVKAPGFRNSTKAPATIKTVAMTKPFEERPQLAAAILNAWAASKPELQEQIFTMLVERNWKVLPIKVNRAKLPGFLTEWPDEDDYEVLYDAYAVAYPESDVSIDEISLMVVWVSGRLPVDKVAKEEIKVFEYEDSETEAD